MSSCYMCGSEITNDNKSEEHIILNACGGRLKSSDLLCIKCNSQFGMQNDAELAKQLNFLANILNIDRERGEPQAIKAISTSDNQEYWIQPDGKQSIARPMIDITINGQKMEIAIKANNEKELRTILRGLKRKYSHFDIDIDDSIARFKKYSNYSENCYQFRSSLGGKAALASVCKTAVNFYLYHGGVRKYIKHLIPYLKNEQHIECVHIFIPDRPVHIIEHEEVSHFIHIEGCSEDKMLYAFVEFFNVCTFIVKLNENYNGEDISRSYCYDILQRTERQKCYSSPAPIESIRKYDYRTSKINYTQFRCMIDRVIGIGLQRQSTNHLSKLISEAIEKSLGQHPEGCIVTKEMIDELMEELMNEFIPYVARLITGKYKKKESEQKDDST